MALPGLTGIRAASATQAPAAAAAPPTESRRRGLTETAVVRWDYNPTSRDYPSNIITGLD